MPGYTHPKKTWNIRTDFKIKAVKLSMPDWQRVRQVVECLVISTNATHRAQLKKEANLMKTISILTLLTIGCLLLGAAAQADAIFPEGEKAKNVHHSGEVWLSHLSEADSVFNYNITVARFAPGAKLDWHFHPAGQQLLILDGKGYYQERGKPVQIVKKGDVIKCIQGLQHWHAAATNSGVTYLAITGNKKTEWFEPVSDAVYNNAEPK